LPVEPFNTAMTEYTRTMKKKKNTSLQHTDRNTSGSQTRIVYRDMGAKDVYGSTNEKIEMGVDDECQHCSGTTLSTSHFRDSIMSTKAPIVMMQGNNTDTSTALTHKLYYTCSRQCQVSKPE
jgi:hypothetical protein